MQVLRYLLCTLKFHLTSYLNNTSIQILNCTNVCSNNLFYIDCIVYEPFKTNFCSKNLLHTKYEWNYKLEILSFLNQLIFYWLKLLLKESRVLENKNLSIFYIVSQLKESNLFKLQSRHTMTKKNLQLLNKAIRFTTKHFANDIVGL